MQDFLFTDLSKQADHYALSLTDLNQTAVVTTADHFIKQVNRLLRKIDNQLIVQDGTSYPEFRKLLSFIDPADVAFVEIEQRTDINESVNATLACNLYLDDGVLCVRPHWCGYKKLRADEIVSSLLMPLYQNGLAGKTYIVESGRRQPLSAASPKAALKQIFNLAMYPRQERMSEYEVDIADLLEKNRLVG